MSYTAVRQKIKEKVEFDPRSCPAMGCPCRASVDLGAGFKCRYHAWSDPHDWPAITEGLIQHDWLRGLMGDVYKLPNKEWRAYAHDFWQAAEPAMVPHELEDRTRYLARMNLELAYRVGASKSKAPQFLKAAGHGLTFKRGGNIGGMLNVRA